MASKSLAFVLVIAFGLTGCVAAAVNSSTLVVKGAARGDLLPEAEAGDSTAQYRLGKSYCCMGPGFDTQTATEWLCKAARQGNTDAMYELGRIYLGDLSRTPAPGQKLRRALTAKRSPSHAHMWLSVASNDGHEHALELLTELNVSIDQDELDLARQLAPNWQAVACEYEEIFGN